MTTIKPTAEFIDALARAGFEAQAQFQRGRGIRDGFIDQWDALTADDLARDEWRAIARALIPIFRRGILGDLS